MRRAYSAVSFGHGHPELVAALAGQASRLAVTSRAFHTDRLGPFLQRLCSATGMDRALRANVITKSGTITTANGIVNVASMTAKSAFRPGNLYLAKA